jgi:hypothetical protein
MSWLRNEDPELAGALRQGMAAGDTSVGWNHLNGSD